MIFWRRLCGLLAVAVLLLPLPARPSLQEEARDFAIAVGALCSVDQSGSQSAHGGFCALCLTPSADPTPMGIGPLAGPTVTAFAPHVPRINRVILASRLPSHPARAPPLSRA